MSKGENTRAAILGQALELTAETGLETLTIGTLSSRAGLSKSGLYAHFRSKEALQIAVLDHAADLLRESVILPAMSKPRGLERLRTLFANWLTWKGKAGLAGCPFTAASADFKYRPGPVHDHLAGQLSDMLAFYEKAVGMAMATGELSSDTDAGQMAFDLWSIIQGYEHYAHMMKRPDAGPKAMTAFENLIDRNRAR
ncbi:TetR family transcriptional regulator [Zhengella mangrovi]|uniref:TetR family transcriptional regulator n=1 Tax=Zhengella mangrovi TaxID=1982044 RepID=A0A2G1QQ35_9HYPH|nr:TetR/AcrR family transcriptional regulator [Zhengella mangrovi]PHP67646.1 TetR family transcriptional regulator [Zhengella mangrovi]